MPSVARSRDGTIAKGSASLNPAGRPKGSRNRFTEAKEAFLQAFEELGGAQGLLEWISEDDKRQGQFYQMVVSLLPRDLTIEAVDSRRSASEYDTSELIALLGESEQLEHTPNNTPNNAIEATPNSTPNTGEAEQLEHKHATDA